MMHKRVASVDITVGFMFTGVIHEKSISSINEKKCFFMCVGHDITSSPLKYGSRVFVAKCSEPQAGNGDVMSEGSG